MSHLRIIKFARRVIRISQRKTYPKSLWQLPHQRLLTQVYSSVRLSVLSNTTSVLMNSLEDPNEPANLPRALARSPTSEQNDKSSSEAVNDLNSNKSKNKLPGLLKRNNSTHVDQIGRKSKPSTPIEIKVPDIDNINDESRIPPGPHTAPIKQEKNPSSEEKMRSNFRNRSVDRQASPHSDHGDYRSRRQNRSRDGQRGLSNSSSQQFRGEGNASHFFSGIKNTTTRAAEGIGKAGNRLIGKINSKPPSTPSKETLDDRDYTYNVIKLPLREQTRATRIAKRLENSKDKTEFWMPALPWRCIE